MFNRRRRLSASMPNQNRWLGYLLFFWAVVYWIFALALERIDLTQTYTLLAALPGIIGNIIELVHPRVLRHFIPVFVGWWFAYMAVVKTVQILYDLPDEEAARHFFKRLRLDRRLQEKPLLVPADRLTDARLQIPMLRIGGPGLVIIRPGEVAVTELQGLIFRTLPAGVHRLGRFEYIQAVLSLQAESRPACSSDTSGPG